VLLNAPRHASLCHDILIRLQHAGATNFPQPQTVIKFAFPRTVLEAVDVSSRRIRILLIEPNPADVRWLEIVLDEARFSYELLRFSSAVQALAALRADEDLRVDVVILAFGLPFLAASEAIARLRALPQFAMVPIAVAVEDEHEIARVQGATHVLVKPIDAEQLHRTLRPQHHRDAVIGK
jgi:CheY-like chemotaxis protein